MAQARAPCCRSPPYVSTPPSVRSDSSDTNWVVPLGPERCQVHYEFFFAPELLGEGDPDELIRESIEQSAVTQQEDISICESVQLGLRSRGYDRGRYAPRLEVGEHQFHGLLARRLRAALLGS